MTKDYTISIKRIEVTEADSVSFMAYIKYRGLHVTLIFDRQGGWKIQYGGIIPKDVILDAKEEAWKRVQKILEKVDEILALSNGLGLVIHFK